MSTATEPMMDTESIVSSTARWEASTRRNHLEEKLGKGPSTAVMRIGQRRCRMTGYRLNASGIAWKSSVSARY